MLQRSPATADGRRTLTFILPLEWAGRVSVVGNFNDWTPGRLTLSAAGGVAEASVDLPSDYIAVFRYLAEGDHWFDEEQADFVDGGGSVVLGAAVEEAPATAVETVVSPAPETIVPAEVREEVLQAAEPQPEASGLLSPAAKAVKVSKKRREREAEAARKAAEKARKKTKKLEDKVIKAALKQRKAAERMAKEREKAAKKLAKKAAKKA